ncbi:MAG: type I restriction enzyme endonuclease domain-containing protein, partial [Candidatus Thorarchaeota archaeon]
FRDEELNLAGCGAKVRKLIEEHILADGVEQLLTPMSILNEQFSDHVSSLRSDVARASEMEHAIRHHITVKLKENPAFYESLREKLEAIIEQRKLERLVVAEVIKKLRGIINEIETVEQKASSLGLSETQFAFHESIRKELGALKPSELKKLSIEIVGALDKLAVVDWIQKGDIQRRMRRRIKRKLRTIECPAESIESLTLNLVDLARERMRR